MKIELTAIIEKSENGFYVGQIEEIPEVLSQAKTIIELKSNLLDALKLYLSVNKDNTENNYIGKQIIKRKILVG